jgi:hypothetical protein
MIVGIRRFKLLLESFQMKAERVLRLTRYVFVE